ncbi:MULTISPECIES: hypothetical protein [Acinetobacter]|uniref:hypothetical protein n=1 Tax=Acinetobacter TaxID=469 RepID=UPI00125F52AB|nr:MULTISPECIES: hypothetical protein [Acinetobacter]MCU4319611.1 hypothetical protein [Acinetobacter bereziniae]
MIELDEVVAGVVGCIEHRRNMAVIPERNTLVARMHGMFRGLIERIGFNKVDIVESVRLAAQKKVQK